MTIKFIYGVAQYSLVGGCVSHIAYIEEKGEELKCVYKDIRLSGYMPICQLEIKKSNRG